MSDWIQTFTGRRFWPLEPQAEDVAIEDIAHALSMTCRYNGHCREFYSVAEHSMLLAVYLKRTPLASDREAQLAALLHDAAEAYLSDVPKSLKPDLPGFKYAEERVQRAIHEAVGLPYPMQRALIKRLDSRILVDEAEALMRVDLDPWHEMLGPALRVEIACLSPAEAERQFLGMFHALTGKE